MIEQVFEAFRQQHIAVVGDVMLDTYWWGAADRISPEAPVPVVEIAVFHVLEIRHPTDHGLTVRAGLKSRGHGC